MRTVLIFILSTACLAALPPLFAKMDVGAPYWTTLHSMLKSVAGIAYFSGCAIAGIGIALILEARRRDRNVQ